MQPSELVITILMSAVISVPMQDIDVPLAHGVIPVVTLISSEVLISFITLKVPGFRRVLSGNPVPVIVNGVINEKALKKLRLTTDDVLEDLRLKNVFDLRTVRLAQIEPNGQISVLLHSEDSPTTPRQMNIKVSEAEPFYTLIIDGVLYPEALKAAGKTEEWMYSMIKSAGAKDQREIFLFHASKSGDIVITKKVVG